MDANANEVRLTMDELRDFCRCEAQIKAIKEIIAKYDAETFKMIVLRMINEQPPSNEAIERLWNEWEEMNRE